MLAAIYAMFGIVEVIGHTAFGIIFWKKFRSKGKQTIYFPGNATAWLLFGPLSTAALMHIGVNDLMTRNEWFISFGILVGYIVLGVLVPQTVFSSRNTPYPFVGRALKGYYFPQYF
jgi:polyferredoxin